MDNQKIIDKGWKKMKSTLDKKMPVDSPVSKHDYFLNSVLLISFFLLFGVLFYNSLEFQKDEPIQNSIEEFGPVNYMISDFNNFVFDEFSQTQNKLNIENDESGDKINSQSFKNTNSKIMPVYPKKSNLSHSIKNSYTHENINKSDYNINKPKFDKIKSIDKSKYLREVNTVNIDRIKIKLDLVEVQREKLKLHHYFPQYYINKEKEGEKKFQHFLTFNLITENGKSFGGVGIAGMVKVKLFGDVSMSGGLDFDFLSKSRMQNSFFNTFNIKDPLENFNARFMDIVEYNANLNSPVLRSKFVKDLFYIGVPLMFDFNVGDFEFDFGVKVSYMITGTNYFNDYSELENFNYLLKSSDNYYKTGIYNKLDYGMSSGINYYFNNNIAITWKFDYSFTWIINSPSYKSDRLTRGFLIYRYNEENRYDKNVYFSLGLKYKLK